MEMDESEIFSQNSQKGN